MLKVYQLIEIPNIKQISMTKIRKPKQCLILKGFGHWILEFEIYLLFGAWDLWFYAENSTAELSISDLTQRTRFFNVKNIKAGNF